MGSIWIGSGKWSSGSSENKTSFFPCRCLARYQSLAKFLRTVLQKLSNVPSMRQISSSVHCIAFTPFPAFSA